MQELYHIVVTKDMVAQSNTFQEDDMTDLWKLDAFFPSGEGSLRLDFPGRILLLSDG